MKKKLLSILTLLIAVCSGAWANQTDLISGFTLPDVPIGTLDLSTQTDYTADAIGWIVETSPKANIGSKEWHSKLGTDGGTAEWTVPEGTIAPFVSSTGSFSRYTVRSGARTHAIRFAGAEKASFLVSRNSDTRRTVVSLFSYNGTSQTPVDTKYMTSGSIGEILFENLSTSTNYIAYIYGTDASSNSDWYEFALKAPVGPTITSHPQSATYITGYAATAMHVEATASAGDLHYQWYRCDDVNKSNFSEISGELAKAASYTPSTANAGTFYYYCKVTDDNGSTESNVATITVSAASAPTISVSGAPVGDIATGTEVTLTAEVTGNPTPTITWFSNTTASTSGATAIAGETSDTFSPSTAIPGTYYYYAQAVNIQGDATSSIQTLVVKDKVATPTFNPNGAYFEGASQSVAITCATADATIQYSTDGGSNWTDYTEPLNVTATTTVKAKATKDGCIDSDEATATFTKVTLDTQVDVTAASTWDWSKFGTQEIKLTDTTTPKKTDEFVLSNVVAYGLCNSINANFGNAQQLKVTAEYVVRDSKFFQGAYINFKTTVPGTVTVEYSNTGNRTDESDRRFLNVNGTNYGVGTLKSSENTTTTVVVAAGEVRIKGTLKKDGSDQYLRIYSIVFTPVTNVSGTITPAGWASFSSNCALDLSTISGGTAYYASNAEGNTVTLKETTATVPAGTGLMIKGTADETFTINIAESGTAIEGNLLKASNGSEVAASTDGAYHYVFGYDKTDASVYGFYNLAQATTVPAGKAYLETTTALTGGGARALIIIDDENTTGISATQTNNETLNNEYFDLQGRRVAQPTKGLYIVNGKKVIVK